MARIKKYIEHHLDQILASLFVSLAYVFVIGFTYAILDYNLDAGVIPFLFSMSVYVLETLIYLTSLVYVFKEW